MEMIPVTSSSNVAAYGYDYESATLRVEFLRGGTYEYYNVPNAVYEGLLAAGSKGTYLDQNVKKAGYSYSKI